MGCIYVRPIIRDTHEGREQDSNSSMVSNGGTSAPYKFLDLTNTVKEAQAVGKESNGKKLVEDKQAIVQGVPASGSQSHSNSPPKKVPANDRYMLHAHPNMRPGNVPKHLEGEQVAAGWPPWLARIAGDALVGWIPRRADAFEKLSKVGQGTYSNVYKARDLDSGKVVAMKKVKFDNLEPESVRFMLREIKILRRLDHPNIIKLEGLVTSRMSCSLYLVFEYMDHDLTGLVSCQETPFTEAQIKCFFKQLLLGLDHCHKSRVLHRDIKGSNLLLDDKGNLKIADFGLASFFDPDQTQAMTSRVVTLWYRPPELLLGATVYGAAIDIWSAGCILAELFAGQPIMPGRTEVEQLHKIFKLCGSPTEEYWRTSNLPHATMFKSQQPYKRCLAETYNFFPAIAIDLLEQLLAIDPAQRGTAADALQSEFFRTKPFACDPLELPKFPPSKEIDARRKHEEVRRQAERQEKFDRKLTSVFSKLEISEGGEVEKTSQVDELSIMLTKSKSTGFTLAEDEGIDMRQALQQKDFSKSGPGFLGSSPVMLTKIEEGTGVSVHAPKSGPAPINNMAKLLNVWKHKDIVHPEDNVHMAPSRPVPSRDRRSLSSRSLPTSQPLNGR
ncbi:hypothetical protein GOP47_0002716 [Adiantum capillus-veneris]|uniref:Protein kinase domain-containing protein n=1 Tax=Adiantum capillus-veneris TaxID=13818 RepID=A0A9D4ZPE0_ADICA|nr:hypothetical protein GOP47_0002716 [Adiantum capillus-veneris]